MRNHMLLLALLLDAVASTDALSAPAQGLQHQGTEFQTTLVAPWRIEGNRALQFIEGDDEERIIGEAVGHLAESSPKAMEHLAESSPTTRKVEQMLEKTEDTPAAEKRLIAYLKRFGRWLLTPWRKWKERSLQKAAINKYTELQEVLASTSGAKGYDTLMLLGHSPLTWKTTSDARGTKGFTELPPYKPIGTETESERLSVFTTYFQAAIRHHEEGGKAVPATYPKTYESLTESQKQKADDLVRNAEKIIAKGHSADDLVGMDITPITYARVLANNGDIELKNEGALADDVIKFADLKTEGKVGTETEGVAKTEAELAASEARIEKYTLYVQAYEKKLLALQAEGKKATVTPPETPKALNTPETPLAAETLPSEAL